MASSKESPATNGAGNKHIYRNYSNRSHFQNQTLSFTAINALALASGLILQLFPRAKKYGHSFRVGSLQGEQGESLWIDSDRGCWKDHATGESGGDLISLYAARENLTQGEAVRRLSEILGAVSFAPAPMSVPDKRKEKDTSYIQDFWSKTTMATGTPVIQYMNDRGIMIPMPESIRHHAQAWHSVAKLHFHCMVAGITRWPDRKIHAVHRTFLEDGKKANVKPVRMMLGGITGGAVRLAPVSRILGLAEGIETALSVQQETGTPFWAVLSTSNYKNLILPDTVQEIIVAADHDLAGIKAAQEAVELWARRGLKVKIALPPIPCTDFNDLLIKECSDAARKN
ncbi:MAG: toprim domain-containing protein [Alphaproteobacteria bacterium]|nr:toprim domain-containing protein [Alphaproteobacteria bacterium]